ncbi:hypothetical protein GCM10017566_05000 [Amycolatopsis bartoniae]|uniref:Uncharacterized protein n=2 Tax=Amycolatopsis bartoniae TaxID=941986 RepID=A0A8H9M313_9PSEU|nr:hypothetical protein GCM10017566_05000 [Amycolatopsis bartoniae]
MGMEVASICLDLGLAVTVIDRDPLLRRLLGGWPTSSPKPHAIEGVGFVRLSARDRHADRVPEEVPSIVRRDREQLS